MWSSAVDPKTGQEYYFNDAGLDPDKTHLFCSLTYYLYTRAPHGILQEMSLGTALLSPKTKHLLKNGLCA